MENNRIQIAGVADAAEARQLVEAGVDDLGFPLGPGVRQPDLSEAEAAAIVRGLPATVGAVWITYLGVAAEIVAGVRRLGVGKVQLHGPMEAGEMRLLKASAPGLYVIRSLVVTRENEAALASEIAATSEWVDAYLTDTFDPATGHRGATGLVHDWAVSARLVEISPRPLILAGGLTGENVFEAICRVRPMGVDSHTGVEGLDGRKDLGRVKRFVSEARRGFSY